MLIPDRFRHIAARVGVQDIGKARPYRKARFHGSVAVVPELNSLVLIQPHFPKWRGNERVWTPRPNRPIERLHVLGDRDGGFRTGNLIGR